MKSQTEQDLNVKAWDIALLCLLQEKNAKQVRFPADYPVDAQTKLIELIVELKISGLSSKVTTDLVNYLSQGNDATVEWLLTAIAKLLLHPPSFETMRLVGIDPAKVEEFNKFFLAHMKEHKELLLQRRQ